MTFSFLKWQEWLKEKALELQDEGYEAKVGSSDLRLACVWMEVTGCGCVASFRNFENAMVDYEVMAVPANVLLANQAMISVSDQNFAAVFADFRKALGAGSV